MLCPLCCVGSAVTCTRMKYIVDAAPQPNPQPRPITNVKCSDFFFFAPSPPPFSLQGVLQMSNINVLRILKSGTGRGLVFLRILQRIIAYEPASS